MTKDTEEFSQFTDALACRQYTLPRDEKSSDFKGWIRGNTQIGPVLEGTFKVNMEWKLENNKGNDNNEQETSEMHFEEFAFEDECTFFCEPLKG